MQGAGRLRGHEHLQRLEADCPLPRSPKGLGDSTVPGAGKKDAREIHSVFAWDAGSKAYAVIVDNEEGTDVDIIDITDPKKGRPSSPSTTSTRSSRRSCRRHRRTSIEVFLHDMVVKQIGGRQVMLLSYWDAGYVAIDVTIRWTRRTSETRTSRIRIRRRQRAASPFRQRATGTRPSSHCDNQYVVAADEDFDPFELNA